MATSYFFWEFGYPRKVLLLAAVLHYLLLVIWKYIFWRLEMALTKSGNALMVGSQAECVRIIHRLESCDFRNYKVKHICTSFDDNEWLNCMWDEIDVVIMMFDIDLTVKAHLMNYCHAHGKKVFLVPGPYELFCFDIQPDKIGDIPVFCTKYLKPTLEQRIIKRLLDLFIAGVALIGLFPLFMMISFAVKITSQGPVFYTQVRVGIDEKEFSIYKFRTMINNAEQYTGPILAVENDPRITSIGRFLRATRLDELPQLINVLCGAMSIVGPRPERPFYVAQYKDRMMGYSCRHKVKPGITGIAQVYGKYNTTPRDKLIYDLIYIQKSSIFTDLVIMFQTVQVLLTKDSTTGVLVNTTEADLAKYSVN
jgi:exopolysaccharide biosynthesis polyprenyl glycosylphosphotransferase